MARRYNPLAYKSVPPSVRAQRVCGPCVVYNHEATKIVSAVPEVQPDGKTKLVRHVEELPPTGPLDLSTLQGRAPRSKKHRVLRGL
jgi:hypothetical protein